jgi:hypothetical protein
MVTPQYFFKIKMLYPSMQRHTPACTTYCEITALSVEGIKRQTDTHNTNVYNAQGACCTDEQQEKAN